MTLDDSACRAGATIPSIRWSQRHPATEWAMHPPSAIRLLHMLPLPAALFEAYPRGIECDSRQLGTACGAWTALAPSVIAETFDPRPPAPCPKWAW